MPLMTGSLSFTDATMVKGYEKDMLDTLSRCREALSGGSANTALQRWFGDATAPFAKEMKEKIAKMRVVLNARDIECKSSQRGGDLDENASAFSYTVGGMFGSTGASTVNRMRDEDTNITIGPNFKNLPKTAAGVPGSWIGQDQFETMVHELSHFALGTIDAKMDNGDWAYTGENARLLVNQSVARAKTNAENWGFFVEEFR